MSKPLLRIVAFLLVPCLLVDPGLAAGLSPQRFLQIAQVSLVNPFACQAIEALLTNFGKPKTPNASITARLHQQEAKGRFAGTATGGIVGMPLVWIYDRLRERGVTEETIQLSVAPILQTIYFKGFFIGLPLFFALSNHWSLPLTGGTLLLAAFINMVVYGSKLVHPEVYVRNHKFPVLRGNRSSLMYRDTTESFSALGSLVTIAFIGFYLTDPSVAVIHPGHIAITIAFPSYMGFFAGLINAALVHRFSNQHAWEIGDISGTANRDSSIPRILKTSRHRRLQSRIQTLIAAVMVGGMTISIPAWAQNVRGLINFQVQSLPEGFLGIFRSAESWARDPMAWVIGVAGITIVSVAWLRRNWVALATGRIDSNSFDSWLIRPAFEHYFKLKEFEKTGRIYEKFGVQTFRKLAFAITRRSLPTYRMRDDPAEYLLRTRYAEVIHIIGTVYGIAGLTISIVTSTPGSLAPELLWTLINLYAVFLQRYTRARLVIFLKTHSADRLVAFLRLKRNKSSRTAATQLSDPIIRFDEPATEGTSHHTFDTIPIDAGKNAEQQSIRRGFERLKNVIPANHVAPLREMRIKSFSDGHGGKHLQDQQVMEIEVGKKSDIEIDNRLTHQFGHLVYGFPGVQQFWKANRPFHGYDMALAKILGIALALSSLAWFSIHLGSLVVSPDAMMLSLMFGALSLFSFIGTGPIHLLIKAVGGPHVSVSSMGSETEAFAETYRYYALSRGKFRQNAIQSPSWRRLYAVMQVIYGDEWDLQSARPDLHYTDPLFGANSVGHPGNRNQTLFAA